LHVTCGPLRIFFALMEHRQIIADAKEPGADHIFAALQTIQQFLVSYGIKGVALSFNGGKDCTALLHLVLAACFAWFGDMAVCRQLLVIYFKQKNEFQEIIDFMRESSKRYGFNIREMDTNYKDGLRIILKEQPIKAIFMGQRRNDPGCKDLSVVSRSTEGWPDFLRVNVILDWTYQQVWDFILKYKFLYCSLYDQGYTSIGLKCNTVPNPKLKVTDEKTNFLPAYLLTEEQHERSGRTKRQSKEYTETNLENLKCSGTTNRPYNKETQSALNCDLELAQQENLV